jgi:hypothetical protein
MIDPQNITNFCRTDDELWEFWLFGLFVAGKNSDTAAKKLDAFLGEREDIPQWLESIDLYPELQKHKVGQYTRLTASINSSLSLDLRDCSLLDMMGCTGPKTARFFLLHSRPDQRLAVVDTHLFKWANENGAGLEPKDRYEYKERKVLELKDKLYPDLSYADFDLRVWSRMRTNLPI